MEPRQKNENRFLLFIFVISKHVHPFNEITNYDGGYSENSIFQLWSAEVERFESLVDQVLIVRRELYFSLSVIRFDVHYDLVDVKLLNLEKASVDVDDISRVFSLFHWI